MKSLARISLLIVLCLASITTITGPARAAYLRSIPQTLTQPNGSTFHCLASGDEYYNWLHDSDGYVIIQDHSTGYYVYAVKAGGEIVPSVYVVGTVDPASAYLEKNIKPSREVLDREIRNGYDLYHGPQSRQGPAISTGTISNIVVFIRFSDEAEFTNTISSYDTQFNSTTPGVVSMHNYFDESSYDQVSIGSTFYPVTGGSTVVSYQDGHPRSYYQPYDPNTNPTGYQGGDNGTQRTDREFILLKGAVNAIASQVPTSLNIDSDGDGKVDNVCFVVKGSPTGWNSLLWPHMWSLYSQTAYINGKRVWTFNFQLQSALNVSVLCHEMSHTLGAPDLYHYSGDDMYPVYTWDIMEYNVSPPQYTCAYMKFRYLHWISSIPEITTSGVYALNPLSSKLGSAYKIRSTQSSSEYYIVEYRRKTGTFESSLPGSGLLVYRINSEQDGQGNSQGPPDEVYIYRPDGTPTQNGSPTRAHFSSDVGRTAINDTTNPPAFLSDGSLGGLSISNISSAGNTISFSVNLGCTPPSITTQPSDVTLCSSGSATFSVTAGGSPPLSYQWQRSANGGTTYANVTTGSGGTTATYTTESSTSGMSGYKFRCVVTGTCTPSATSDAATLTVNPPVVAPTSASANPSTICSGTNSTLTAVGGSGAGCKWYTAGCGGTLVGTGTSLVVSPTSTKTYYVRWETTGCGNSTCATTTLTVNPAVVAPTSATATPSTVCAGSATTLTAVGGSGASCKWYSGSCGGTAVGTGTSISVSPTSNTQYWVRWESPGCGSSTCATVTVTASAPPVAPTSAAASPSTICSGASATLTATGGSGDSCKWYTGSCGGTAVGTGTSISVSPGSTTTYYARWERACGGSACVTTTVTVNPALVAPTSVVASPGAICLGGTTTLTAVGGSGIICKWYAGSCGGILLGTGTSISVSPTSNTQYWARWETPGCGETACAVTMVTVSPPPDAPTSASASPNLICYGESTTLTATGGAGDFCKWYAGTCGGTAVGTGTSISVSPTSTTTYYVRWEKACGGSACATTTVSVTQLPLAPTSVSASPAAICSGDATTLTASGGAGSTCVWFAGSCGGTLLGTGTSISVAPASTSTYYVRWENDCGVSTCSTTSVTVNPLPVAPTSATASPATICYGGSTELTASGGSGNTLKWYTSGCGGALVGAGPSVSVHPATTTTYYARWETPTCGSSACTPVTVTVIAQPVAPSSASAHPATICYGGSSTLTANGGSGTTCNWYTGSCGGTLVGTGTSIGVTPTSTTTYYARWEKDCGNSACATTTVVVAPLPVAPASASASPDTICLGASTTLTVSGGAGTTCAWYTDSCGGTLVGTGASISISPTATTTYYVRWENSCGVSTCATTSVTVNELTVDPASALASPSTICVGESSTLTAVGGSGANCAWYAGSCGGTPVGTGTSISVSPTSTTTYYLRWENNCGVSTCATTTVTVNPLPVAPTSAQVTPAIICAGESSTLTAVGGSGDTCKWYADTCGGTPIGTGVSIVVKPSSTTTYFTRWETASCGNSACATTSVNVNPLPEAPTSAEADPPIVCMGGSTKLTAIGGSGGVCRWYTGSCGEVPIGTGVSIVVSPDSATTYYARWETASCGNSACAAVPVLVKPLPVPPAYTSASPSLICSGATSTLTATGGSGDSCAWYAGDCGGTLVGRGTSIVVSPTTSTTYYARWETTNCGNSTCVPALVSVEPPPAIQITSPTADSSCWRNHSQVVVSGTASATCGNIVSVLWSNNRGGSGTCTGTTQWKATVPLQLGANVITVTTSDTSGRVASDELAISYVDAQPGAAWSGMAMISVPVIPDNTDPKQVVGFDANNWYAYMLPAGYVGYSNRLSWFDPAGTTPGRGFWARFPARGRTVVPSGNIPPQNQPFTIHLSAGWNLIGQPFLSPVKWDRATIMVVQTGQQAGALASSAGVLDGPVWGWDATKGTYYTVHDATLVPGDRNQLEPWQAYWIKTNVDCDLVLPAP